MLPYQEQQVAHELDIPALAYGSVAATHVVAALPSKMRGLCSPPRSATPTRRLVAATKAARTAPMAKRRVRYPIAPISVSAAVKFVGYYGLRDPPCTLRPSRTCPLYQPDLRRGHLRPEPALPVVVVKGAVAVVALRLLLV